MTHKTSAQSLQQTNLRIAEQLLADNKITREGYEAAISHLKRYGGRIEEALLEVNALPEEELLSYLAVLYRTRFITTERLSKIEVGGQNLDRLPRKVAEKWLIVPARYESASGTLTIITADPHNVEMLDEARLASGAKEVKAIVARPAAAKAAFNRVYLGDIHAFANIDKKAQEQFAMLMNVYERNLVTEDSMSAALVQTRERERTVSAEDFDKTHSRGKALSSSDDVSSDSYAETLNVLISLLENSRTDLRGHSAHVARLARKLAERIGLEPREIHAIVIAAYLHDLGKAGPYHLTALNVAQYEGHRLAAGKAWLLPTRLMEGVALPETTTLALGSMYERYDGSGLPRQRVGNDIPLGARILAIADSFADLTQNPRNPARRILKPLEACELLASFKGSVFDPNLFDLFRSTVTGEDLRARILYNRSLALLVDSDPEETTVLELRMLEEGFEVEIARSAEQAFEMLESGEFEVVVSEIDLGAEDGLTLLEKVRQQPWGRELPWLILTKRQSRADAQRAFGSGVIDYVVKPAVSEVLVTKLKQALETRATHRAARGVSGSLLEMSLPDLVQILWHGKKTGLLKLRQGGEAGEIHFAEGQLVNAMWGSHRGEEAFYKMLTLQDGEFVLDPNFQPSSVLISTSPEALLLEGMRRLDEGQR